MNKPANRYLGVRLGDYPECKEYYAARRHCPQCGGRDFEQTCMGCMPSWTREGTPVFHDTNRVRCTCGWSGIVHDLSTGKLAPAIICHDTGELDFGAGSPVFLDASINVTPDPFFAGLPDDCEIESTSVFVEATLSGQARDIFRASIE